MYEEYFSFTSPPFSIAPDPHYLYMSERHKEALAHLLYGIRSDGGFVLLTGEVGTGKTTVCRCLLEQVPDNTDIAFILNPKLTVRELLATICDEFGIKRPENQGSIKVFVDLINSFLLRSHAKGRKAVLIIDEAQNLSVNVLEQIRLLTNLETNKRKLLQIIMLGQPELKDILARSEMRQLAQRITARYHLDPLSEKEVGSYVAHRLSVAGGRSRIFPASTIKTLYKLSHGTPRLINIICDRALLGTYVQDQDQVNITTLKKAAQEIFGETDQAQNTRGRMSGLSMALLVLLVCGALFAAVFYGKNQEIKAFFTQAPLDQTEQVVVPESVEPEEIARPVVLEEEVTVEQPVVLEAPAAPEIVAVQSTEIDVNPQPHDVSPLQWPGDKPIAESKEMAYQALFASWGVIRNPGSDPLDCTVAKSYNLRCLHRQGSLESLLDLNRPAVLTLYDDNGEPFFATLTAFHGQTATFVIGSETKIVSLDDIRARWIGEYSLLWAKPKGYAVAITPGNTDENVDWLDKKLALIQGRPASPGSPVTFAEELVKEVKQFQFSRNLVPDGIVGPQTIIHLNSACGKKVPKIVDKKEGE